MDAPGRAGLGGEKREKRRETLTEGLAGAAHPGALPLCQQLSAHSPPVPGCCSLILPTFPSLVPLWRLQQTPGSQRHGQLVSLAAELGHSMHSINRSSPLAKQTLKGSSSD